MRGRLIQVMAIAVQASTVAWENVTVNDDDFHRKEVGVRTVVAVSCVLSILGGSLIVVSYLCFRSVRSRAREILLHISIADIGVAISNLIGVLVYFDQFLRIRDRQSAVADVLCRTQAFFAIYFSYSSVLWTISLAVYLYLLILHHGSRLSIYSLRLSYLFCYGLPLFLSLWLVLTNRAGYSPYDSSGWCSIIDKDPWSGKEDVFVTVFGYDLWIYLAMVINVVIYIAVHLYVRQQLQISKQFVSEERFWRALQRVDYKFLLIPLVFALLRVWTCIIDVVYIYCKIPPVRVQRAINEVLIYLSGIGDSGQGFANAILFVVFTSRVRNMFLHCLSCGRVKREESEGEEETEVPVSPVALAREGWGVVAPNLSVTCEEHTPLLYESLESSWSPKHISINAS